MALTGCHIPREPLDRLATSTLVSVAVFVAYDALGASPPLAVLYMLGHWWLANFAHARLWLDQQRDLLSIVRPPALTGDRSGPWSAQRVLPARSGDDGP